MTKQQQQVSRLCPDVLPVTHSPLSKKPPGSFPFMLFWSLSFLLACLLFEAQSMQLMLDCFSHLHPWLLHSSLGPYRGHQQISQPLDQPHGPSFLPEKNCSITRSGALSRSPALGGPSELLCCLVFLSPRPPRASCSLQTLH